MKTLYTAVALALFLLSSLSSCSNYESQDLNTSIHSQPSRRVSLPVFDFQTAHCAARLCQVFGEALHANYKSYLVEPIEAQADEAPGFYVSANGADWSNSWELRHREAAGQILLQGQRGLKVDAETWSYKEQAWILDYVHGKLVEINPQNHKEVLDILEIRPEDWILVQSSCWKQAG